MLLYFNANPAFLLMHSSNPAIALTALMLVQFCYCTRHPLILLLHSLQSRSSSSATALVLVFCYCTRHHLFLLLYSSNPATALILVKFCYSCSATTLVIA
ncbi:hypothetical protein RchiOBHm_Chr7g0190861 [Rosa chinensis]|uniref:Uncharacterized protein n=1 Tax=Rosa chinensis TaxID=74649 RepID=A0A2P6P557_ROSCH|nr:hypothetical protein RchiOBHm_Chr7g0190861 [Rosa chinensis]